MLSTLNGNTTERNASAYKIRHLPDRLIMKVNSYMDILAAKRIERREIKYKQGTTTLAALDNVIVEVTAQGTDAFSDDVAVMRAHLDSELDFGEFKLFHTAYESRRRQCELEFIVIYARKRRHNQHTVVEYFMASYNHVRNQNETAKIAGAVVTGIGVTTAGIACLISGPVGWTALGMGGAAILAGIGTAVAGTDDSITGAHGEDIEAGVVGHMLESGMATRDGNNLLVEFN